jgi:transposase
MKIKDARSLKSPAQEALRRRAVQAVREGMRQTQAAEVFGVHRSAVAKWMRRYREGGAKALRAKKRGRPPQSRLAPWQSATMVRMITDRCPDQLKLRFALWTREAVGELLAQKFGIEVSVWTVGRYLKPLRRAFEQDPAAVRRWLEEEYPKIKRQAKRERAEIHWGDEMGMRSDHQAGRSYGRRGQTPVIPGTGQRFGCNMISTITNRGKLRFMVFPGEFNAAVFLKFLGRLLKSVRGKVFLIVDQHPSHVARKVKRWVKQWERRLRIFFLPGYSPELNPDEYLNNDVKSNAVGRQRAEDKEELQANVRAYLRSTQRRPDVVRNYFQARPVRYAA